MLANNEDSGTYKKLKIQNPAEIAYKVGALVICCALTVPWFVGVEETTAQLQEVLGEFAGVLVGLAILGPIAAVLIPITIIQIYVLWGGFIIDPSRNTFSIPSGMEANSFLTYLNPFWWLHRWGLKRRKVALDEITQVSTELNVKQRMFSRKDVYNVKVEGPFGAIACEFVSKGKRDQLYSMFQQILQMGVPITKV